MQYPVRKLPFPKVEKMKETQVWSLFGKPTVGFYHGIPAIPISFPKDGTAKVFPVSPSYSPFGSYLFLFAKISFFAFHGQTGRWLRNTVAQSGNVADTRD